MKSITTEALGDFVTNVEHEAGGKDHQVVVYCADTECESSIQAGKKMLEREGLTNDFEYEGGATSRNEVGEKLVAVSARERL